MGTNFKSRSRPTNDNPKKPKNRPTPTSANTESSNTNLTKQKNEPTWPNLPSTSSDPKPDPTRFNKMSSAFFGQFKSLIQKNSNKFTHALYLQASNHLNLCRFNLNY